MIQKYLKIQAPKEQVMAEILDIDSWPQWWPGVKQATIQRQEPNLNVVDLVISVSMTVNMTMEFDLSLEDTIRFRQLEGWFKRYKGEWRLMTGQNDSGTTLKVTTELECGAFVPKAMVYSKLGDSLNLFEAQLNQRLKEKGTATPAASPAADTAESRQKKGVAHVFPTNEGLEIWIAGRPYLARAAL